ncbi:MAG TPA: acyloxyacyl hydrolase [Nitrospira sp.]|nr:acyloxyacyl hydrolase [Nitrospira sp.]
MTPSPLVLLITFAVVLSSLSIACEAGDSIPHLTVGTQEIGLSAGYLLPHRLTNEHTTKQSGPAIMPSWAMVLTDPIGWRWVRGQLMLGVEIVYIQFQEPELTHGVGFTPKIKWMFEGTGRLRPYIEFAGGPFYTDLGGRIPEESARFNFILTAGGGLSWFVTPHLSFNIGYRFHHISNAGTRYPNLGLNSSLPFGGFSFYF